MSCRILLLPGDPARPAPLRRASRSATLPLISCIMASRGRPFPALHAIGCFRRQTYPHRELVIATAARDDVLGAYVRRMNDPCIRLIEVSGQETPGRLRNAAIAEARGALVAVWDDDDLATPDRLSMQQEEMNDAGVAACFLGRVLLWWPARRLLAASAPRIWENTMLARRVDLPPYRQDAQPGEDTEIVTVLRATRSLLLVDRPEAYCYVAHGANICGTQHFEMLFDRASRQFAAAEYEAALRELSLTLPMTTYAAAIAGSVPG